MFQQYFFFLGVSHVHRLKGVKPPHIKIYENIISIFNQIESQLR